MIWRPTITAPAAQPPTLPPDQFPYLPRQCIDRKRLDWDRDYRPTGRVGGYAADAVIVTGFDIVPDDLAVHHHRVGGAAANPTAEQFRTRPASASAENGSTGTIGQPVGLAAMPPTR